MTVPHISATCRFVVRQRYKRLSLLLRAGFRKEAGGPGPQASHQQGVSHQTPQFLKPCNSIANPFLKSQIRHLAQASHQGPQASHQLNPALVGLAEILSAASKYAYILHVSRVFYWLLWSVVIGIM